MILTKEIVPYTNDILFYFQGKQVGIFIAENSVLMSSFDLKPGYYYFGQNDRNTIVKFVKVDSQEELENKIKLLLVLQ